MRLPSMPLTSKDHCRHLAYDPGVDHGCRSGTEWQSGTVGSSDGARIHQHILHVVIGTQKGPVYAQRSNVLLRVVVILGQRSDGIRARRHR